ncbi:MAG: Uma2 family endonuclease [Thermomicrobiales bacterium]|nr:Uma2 family endonuclease [Thermomicrobiales bacterium]
MVAETRISEETYQRLALAEPTRKWELRDGRLEERPGMTWERGTLIPLLGHLLVSQLDPGRHRALAEVRVRCANGSILIPDLVVAPTTYGDPFRGRPGVLAVIAGPLPLVVEIWSASTGKYDVAAKVPEYQRRGDREIWLVHPCERTLTAWRRQPDGTYEEREYRSGTVTPAALPNVEIDLEALFNG